MRRFLVVALVVVALAIATRGLVRHTTWYLASDQFAFLTFAADLRDGRVFHDPNAIPWARWIGVPTGTALDAYYQTYLWRDERLYSRYPPGYPLMLAATGALGGERALHVLNPLLYLLLLAGFARAARRMLEPVDRDVAAGVGAALPWMLLLVPAEVHYWGITIARDLPAHLLGFGAVVAAFHDRLGRAGLLLGLACTVRPDAVLYGASIVALTGIRVRPATLRAAGTFAIGALPLFAYNTITQGHPFAFTQGMEFRDVLGDAAASPPVVLAASPAPPLPFVSGGAFQLAHLATTLPIHAAYLRHAFGACLVAVVLGLAWALRHHRRFVAAIMPYATVAFVFYSCWGHGDPRYLVGVVLSLVVLATVGLVVVARQVGTPGRALRRIATAVIIAALVWWAPHGPIETLRPLERTLAVACVAAALIGRVPLIRSLAPLAPALAITVLALTRIAGGDGKRDPFQEAQVDRARAAIESLVPAGAYVVTTPSLGRPGENIEHYTWARSPYAGEFKATRLVIGRLLESGSRVFLLYPPGEKLPVERNRVVHITEIARREGPALYDWFIDPRRATAGAILWEVTVNAGS